MDATQKQNCDRKDKTNVGHGTVAVRLSEKIGSVTRSKNQSGHRSSTKVISYGAPKRKLVDKDMAPYNTIAQVSNGNSLMIYGFINNLSCKFVVDTGASRTIVSSELLQHQIQKEKCVPDGQLETATGERIRSFGKIDFQFKIGNLIYPQSVTMAQITDDCLLGLDFLTDHKCIIDLNKGVIVFPDQEIQFSY
ncbi:protein DDI1 homolog [Vanessa atalanta]|uniref:protein DDI1 homolog n=1 Tax=Vanessa atalanta TaxID=42275 RepID=UPI001FCCDD1D|nr:protein DDI1 homolog [Vanessa atalanta]